ncbi:hypothetical protein SAMN04489806_0928 [Paramicrobacterium humi]|uniref:NAD(P)-binding domain-containing protein n=1 Tax=Paramicrobacterium humi TaxID=640635 RepID=A0A1H4JYJ2_9MICO|nr:NAD(P)H-binding protein [Microbacterium humi]SEB51361.1 hypothetical protein SAMN04489806_0928 [Microbacterium humi]
MSHVVVFGATGYAGGHITDELLSRGHTVTGVARDTSALANREGLTARQGSVHDAEFVRDVSTGADVLIVALRAAEQNGEKLLDAMPSVAAAASAQGARLGLVGGAGSLFVSDDGPLLVETPEFPEVAKNESLSHKKVLDYLRSGKTDVDWFYVSPAGDFGSWVPGERTGSFRVGDDVLLSDADGKSYISGADLAIAFADEIEEPTHNRARFTVAY